MSMNLVEEIASREAERYRDEYDEMPFGGMPGIRRAVAPIVADVLDILTAEGRLAPAIEPGPCWHDSGTTWPNGVVPRCELRAGHAGAHECGRGDMGGTAVWPQTDDVEATRP